MTDTDTARWAIGAQVLPFQLADLFANINSWGEDSIEREICVRGWNDDLFRLATSGQLTFRSAQGVPLQQGAEAFNLGFVDLHDLCEWANRVGSTGIPNDARVLAKTLGFDVELQPTPVEIENAAESELNVPWWKAAYDMPELWQNIGATLHSQNKRPSNSAIAKEIEKRINQTEKSKGRNRASPSWDTIRDVFTGWAWKVI